MDLPGVPHFFDFDMGPFKVAICAPSRPQWISLYAGMEFITEIARR